MPTGDPERRAAARAAAAQLRAQGAGDRRIARALNDGGYPTATGRGTWHPTSVYRLLDPTGWAGYHRGYRARHTRYDA